MLRCGAARDAATYMLDNGLHVTLELEPGFTGTFDTITVSDADVAKFALTTNLHLLT